MWRGIGFLGGRSIFMFVNLWTLGWGVLHRLGASLAWSFGIWGMALVGVWYSKA
jgi:hypothetical protein